MVAVPRSAAKRLDIRRGLRGYDPDPIQKRKIARPGPNSVLKFTPCRHALCSRIRKTARPGPISSSAPVQQKLKRPQLVASESGPFHNLTDQVCTFL